MRYFKDPQEDSYLIVMVDEDDRLKYIYDPDPDWCADDELWVRDEGVYYTDKSYKTNAVEITEAEAFLEMI